ncbi:TRAF3-interacting protein 1-like isoform X2 [Hippocampus comes]|uniref:TRAF3-interacting protein 1-like isoform X2 n=1 Tax=Hippocampus comes TaxID=109280 RepID=UPI00094F0172|nr:PREDICTED: TRAF3-interacting protein 1-like isoform X2 [Hippocampus comes]
MNESVVKKTQEALGKVIKKPPLTEKLLSKPPFRYLHDIFNEIIRTTGFMKGLYKDSELKSDNVKDKETKIAFLQKAIDVVILVSGESLAAKPARIVAGHEPEKTNELLQAIAKCCLNKLSSEEAVKRILSGEKVDSKIKAPTKSQDKENREGREHRPVERQEEKRIERSGSREDKDPDQRRERVRQHRDGERDHRHDRERSGKNQRREQDRAKDAERDKSRERDKDKGSAKDRDKEKDKEHERDRDKSRDRDRMRERESVRRDTERSRDKRRERDKEAERRKDGEDKNRSQEREIHSKDRISDGQQKPTEDEPRKTAKPVPSEPEPAAESDSPARIPRPSSAKGQRRKPRLAGQDESDSEGNADPPKESGDAAGASFPPETPSSNKRMARPSSARAAPPRVKKQESLNDGVPAERLSSAKSSVIREGKKRSDDEDEEDEQFLVAEAAPEPAEAQEKEYAQDLTGDEKHGGLVKKILETKKDFEPPPSSTKSKEKPVSGEALKKEQDLVTREVERLRASIQSVCQSALPLGKIMDYVQEDIDAMQAELQSWRKENKEHAQALLQEQKATDWALEPLKAELYELDQMIKDYQDKICAVRSNILRNEEKIQKKLTGIISSST